MFNFSILESVISRRGLMGGALGGLAAAGLTACGAPMGGQAESSGAAAPDTGGGLDLSNPADNLYAFGKIWGTYADTPGLQRLPGRSVRAYRREQADAAVRLRGLREHAMQDG